MALVLAPQRSARSQWSIGWAVRPGAAAAPAPTTLAALAGNAMADALPLFEALAGGHGAAFALPLTPQLALALDLQAL